MHFAPRAIVVGLLGAAVSLLAACGGGAGLLSGSQSSTLNSQLDAVSSAVDGGQCRAATSAVTNFSNEVAKLPPSINTTLQANLDQGASTLATLASRDCRTNSTATNTTSSSTTSSSSTSTTSSTTPASTSTTSSTTTPTSTTTTTTPPPPSTTTTTAPATSTTSPGTSTGGVSGGAGLGGGPGAGNTGGAGTGNGNGNGNGQ